MHGTGYNLVRTIGTIDLSAIRTASTTDPSNLHITMPQMRATSLTGKRAFRRSQR